MRRISLALALLGAVAAAGCGGASSSGSTDNGNKQGGPTAHPNTFADPAIHAAEYV